MDGVFENITLQELALVQDLARQSSLRSLGRTRKLQASYLSKALRRIERKLGTSLVLRSSKGIVFTPEGMRIARVADEILRSARGLSSKTVDVKAAPQTLLSLAAPRFICTEIIAPLAESLRQSYPHFRFRILDMAPDQIAAAAMASACEIVVTVGSPALSAAWDIRRCGKLEWGLFASSRHPLSGTVTEAQITEYPFVVPNYWTGESFERGSDHCPLPWEARIAGDETSAISSAVEVVRRSGMQLVFAPRVVCRTWVEKAELKELRVPHWPPVSKNIYVGVRADRVKKVFQKELISRVKESVEFPVR